MRIVCLRAGDDDGAAVARCRQVRSFLPGFAGKPMACGIGICFSCVARVRDETGEWDYRRICVEGPVFDAAKIEF